MENKEIIKILNDIDDDYIVDAVEMFKSHETQGTSQGDGFRKRISRKYKFYKCEEESINGMYFFETIGIGEPSIVRFVDCHLSEIRNNYNSMAMDDGKQMLGQDKFHTILNAYLVKAKDIYLVRGAVIKRIYINKDDYKYNLILDLKNDNDNIILINEDEIKICRMSDFTWMKFLREDFKVSERFDVELPKRFNYEKLDKLEGDIFNFFNILRVPKAYHKMLITWIVSSFLIAIGRPSLALNNKVCPPLVLKGDNNYISTNALFNLISFNSGSYDERIVTVNDRRIVVGTTTSINKMIKINYDRSLVIELFNDGLPVEFRYKIGENVEHFLKSRRPEMIGEIAYFIHKAMKSAKNNVIDTSYSDLELLTTFNNVGKWIFGDEFQSSYKSLRAPLINREIYDDIFKISRDWGGYAGRISGLLELCKKNRLKNNENIKHLLISENSFARILRSIVPFLLMNGVRVRRKQIGVDKNRITIIEPIKNDNTRISK